MKVRITVRPVGYLSLAGDMLRPWPKVGEVIDLPDVVANDMIASGRAEKVPAIAIRK